MDGSTASEEQYRLPDLLLRVFRTGVVWDEFGKSYPLEHSISKAEAEAIYQLVRDTRPQKSVETGFAYGISTVAILQACQDNNCGIHHVIDPFQSHYHNIGLAMVRASGLKRRLHFYREHSWEVIPHLGDLEFAFIDSSHLFDLTIQEFVLIDFNLKVGGLLVFHDLWLPAIERVIEFIVTNRNYCLRMADDLGNLAILEKLGDDGREWTHFIDFEIDRSQRE